MTIATSVVVGPDEHGVVRHALAVAAAADVDVLRHRDVAACCADGPPHGVTHWHFTDQLFGTTVEGAAQAFLALAAATTGPHVVTLHDVPAATAAGRDRRRAAAYRQVAGACAGVIVASRHERRRIEAAGIAPAGSVTVIPLPITASAAPDAGPARRTAGRQIGVLGFVYPGKGHVDVVVAARSLPPDVGIVAIGRASDGHEELLTAIRLEACASGRRLVATGFLDDLRLAVAMDAIDVPVVPATDVSASASVGTWIGAGRRPLVASNGYTRELAAIDADLVTLVAPGELAPAIRAALDRPESTRRSRPVPAALTLAAVARAHRALYRRIAT